MVRGGKRTGAGRPIEENPKVIVNFRCTKEEHEMIKRKAKNRNKSVGRFIVETVNKEGEE